MLSFYVKASINVVNSYLSTFISSSTFAESGLSIDVGDSKASRSGGEVKSSNFVSSLFSISATFYSELPWAAIASDLKF